MLKNKTILYLVHNYNSFQKDPIEEVSKHFKKVYVLVRYKPISKIVKYLPFKSLKKFEDTYVIDLNNVPDNVEVIRVPVWYLPFGIFFKLAGYTHYRAVRRIIKKYNIKFDLIHSHFTWTAGYVGMKLKEEYKKPFVITAHGFDVYKLPFKSNDWKRRIVEVLESADRVLTVSKNNERIIKELGVGKIDVFPNGYSENLFYNTEMKRSRDITRLPQEKRIILTVGNLETVKGYEYLIKSIKLVSQKITNILCIHIGAGSLESTLKKLVEDYGIADNFKFLGKKPHHELVDYFGASEIFVSSSLREGNPTVMFETLGCGKPFVGTRVGGVPEIIKSEDYGLLCDSCNEKSLAKNIEKALKKDWSTEKIISYGKQFSWRNVCKNIIEIYKQTLR